MGRLDVIAFLLLSAVSCLAITQVAGDDGDRLEFYEKIFRYSEQVERTPQLKSDWNKRRQASSKIEVPPPAFKCDTSIGISPEKPTSVHKLRPGDIDVIAAFGDSISAGNGLGAQYLPEVAVENRGEVFSIGGDRSLEEGVVTMPNIFRKFNPNLKGFSLCASQESNADKSWFNVAKPGGTSDDMPSEAQLLVERMKADPRVNYTDDWKFLTMFVGGNDLCASCRRNYSAEAYYAWFESALLYLKANMPRTVVNLVSMFDVTLLETFSTGLVCDLLQWGFCDCARNWTTIPTMRPIQLSYDEQYEKLANDPRFKADDFTVIRQPQMRDMEPPRDPDGDGWLQGFLSPDCFHPNRIAHQGFAAYYWNTLFIPVGQKPTAFDSNEFNITLSCPTEEFPYIFTDENSPPPPPKRRS